MVILEHKNLYLKMKKLKLKQQIQLQPLPKLIIPKKCLLEIAIVHKIECIKDKDLYSKQLLKEQWCYQILKNLFLIINQLINKPINLNYFSKFNHLCNRIINMKKY
jgi:hypothetical protein